MASKFKTGVEAASETNRVPFDKTGFFSMKDGESKFFRWLSDADEWITVEYHSFVPVVKSAPEGVSESRKKNWPKQLSAVCRKTKGADGRSIYPDCVIDQMKGTDGTKVNRSTRIFSVGIVQEPITQNGKRVGFRDALKEVAILGPDGKPSGDTKSVPDIQYVVMGYKNFYGPLEGYAEGNGTLLDQVYMIKRKGADQTTAYNFFPQGVTVDTPDLRDPEVAAKYGIEIVDGERIYPDKISVENLIDGQMSDEYFGMYFDESKPQISNGEVVESNDSNSDSGDMQSRIKAYASKASNSEPDYG